MNALFILLRAYWALKNWCFKTMVLEKTLESPLDGKIKSVNPKGNWKSLSCVWLFETSWTIQSMEFSRPEYCSILFTLFSRGSSQPMDRTQVSHIAGGFFYQLSHHWKVLMLKLKLQNFGHLMWRADSLEKTLMLGNTEGRRRGRQRMRWPNGTTDSMDLSLSKLWETWWRTVKPSLLQSMGLQSRTQLSNWTRTNAPNNLIITESEESRNYGPCDIKVVGNIIYKGHSPEKNYWTRI